MSPGSRLRRPHRIYYRSRWLRVNDGGIFLTERKLGEAVQIGDPLGTVTDPITNERSTVIAPFRGRIIGMAVPQVVIPGFAAFHIGIEQPGQELDPEPEPDHGLDDSDSVLRADQLDPEEAPE
jgi:predicted deacylase